MVQRLPDGYVFDPTDPRAPTKEQWARMTPDERASVTDMLPSSPSSSFDAKVLEVDLLIARLGHVLNEAVAAKEEAERRAQTEAERAQMAEERAEQLEKRLAALQAELERLKRGG